jgi:uncharacterized protein YdiU (UPF0061 family)
MGTYNRPMATKLTDLPWQSHFVSHLAGDPNRDNSTRQVRNAAYSEVFPTPVPRPELLGWSAPLADELGIAEPSPSDRPSLDLLAGNLVLPCMRPYAARYGGHQFGHWAGQLGDGRAITLGEVPFPPDALAPLFHIPQSEKRNPQSYLEFQLKGPGLTPYSRRGDGRAVLRSSLREFLCSEAMHHLGVPTTRALSLVSTGDTVIRDMFYDGNPAAEPGAIVCRVAPSFLRFGNFEILTAYEEYSLLGQLTDYLVANFYPDLNLGDPDVYGQLLDEICRRTAHMIVHWQRVGFVHGVMNTDNMSALGLTIDYGPYGWLEPYDPTWTPNTTDAAQRRYRFGNQPAVALWNLNRLAAAFHPLVKSEDRLHQSLDLYRTTFQTAHNQMLSQKLGLSSLQTDDDLRLVTDMDELLQAAETDYTIFFRQLSDWPANSDAAVPFIDQISPAFYSDSTTSSVRERWTDWSERYVARVRNDTITGAARSQSMKRVNPKYVLRNYMAQNAITAAEQGDLSHLERLLRVLQTPYADLPADEDLYARRPEWARTAPGCSALSCSS